MFRYCQKDWSVEPKGDGFMLRSGPRVLAVNDKGVFECSRDGQDTPLELMDCNAKVLAALKSQAPRP